MAPTSIDPTNLSKALALFIHPMRDWVSRALVKEYGPNWPAQYANMLTPIHQQDWERKLREAIAQDPQNPQAAQQAALMAFVDYGNLGTWAVKMQSTDSIRKIFGKESTRLKTWFDEIKDVRNDVNHYQSVQPEDAERAWGNMRRIASKLGLADLVAELDAIKAEALHTATASGTATAAVAATATGIPSAVVPQPQPTGTARGWRSVVTPTADIRNGYLDDSRFAASLDEVYRREGREEYVNAGLFFGQTYMTQGLWNVLELAAQGLSGEGHTSEAANRVLSLQTNFGGGKTHTLIALYHLAKAGPAAGQLPGLQTPPKGRNPLALLPKPAKVAVFTQLTLDAVGGRTTEDGFQIRTPWGEIAYQLGGAAGYALVQEQDQAWSAPGDRFRELLRQHTPCLILVDELADYATKVLGGASEQQKARLANVVSFVQDLTTAVRETPQTVLVATMPVSDAEVADLEQVKQILAMLEHRLGRMAADHVPVNNDEIFEVIRRRLFEPSSFDDAHNPQSFADRRAVITAYANYYESIKGHLPGDVTTKLYRDKMERAYPFHPSIIQLFQERWSVHSKFQRTRGVLRMLATIVHHLWKAEHNGWLIHPSQLDVNSIDAIKSNYIRLTSQSYQAALNADVAKGGTATHLDAEKFLDKPDPCFKIANTILLSSIRDEVGSGLTEKEIKLQTLEARSELSAQLTPSDIESALRYFRDRAHYLYTEKNKDGEESYLFRAVANLNVLIAERKRDLKESEKLNAIWDLVQKAQQASQNGASLRVLLAPASSDPNLEEQQSPTLLLLHPKFQATNSAKDALSQLTQERIRFLATHCSANIARKNRNTIVFLVADTHGLSQLQETIAEVLARKEVVSTMLALTDDQKSRIKNELKEWEQAAEQKLSTTYVHLVKYQHNYQGEERFHSATIQHPTNSFIEFLSEKVIEKLRKEEWLLPRVGISRLQTLKLLPEPDQPNTWLSLRDFASCFIRFDDKPMLEQCLDQHRKRQLTGVEETLKLMLDHHKALIAYRDAEEWTQFWGPDAERLPSDLKPWLSEPGYFIVHPSAKPKLETVPSSNDFQMAEIQAAKANPFITSFASESSAPRSPKNETHSTPEGEAATAIQQVRISGQLDPGFLYAFHDNILRPLLDTNIELVITVKATPKPTKPIDRNSMLFKNLDESAHQLKLQFEAD